MREKEVLAVPYIAVTKAWGPERGLLPYKPQVITELIAAADFYPRDIIELDPNYTQLISYTYIQNSQQLIYSYQRGKRMRRSRLVDLFSIGFGGHVDKTDSHSLFTYPHGDKGLLWAATRELAEETKIDIYDSTKLEPQALIFDDSYHLGRTHFGIVYKLVTDIEPNKGEQAVKKLSACTVNSLVKNYHVYEYWSQWVIYTNLSLPNNSKLPHPSLDFSTLQQLIVIVGHTGCGKTLISDYLRKQYDFGAVSASGVLRHLLGERTSINNRLHFQTLCTNWVKEHGGEKFGKAIAEHCSNNDVVVIDGLRVSAALETLAKRLNGRVKILGVTCPERCAYERQLKRNELFAPIENYKDFLEIRNHQSESEIESLLKRADQTIDNTKSLEDLYEQVDTLLPKLLYN